MKQAILLVGCISGRVCRRVFFINASCNAGLVNPTETLPLRINLLLWMSFFIGCSQEAGSPSAYDMTPFVCKINNCPYGFSDDSVFIELQSSFKNDTVSLLINNSVKTTYYDVSTENSTGFADRFSVRKGTEDVEIVINDVRYGVTVTDKFIGIGYDGKGKMYQKNSNSPFKYE